jgi:hypothetical protein
MADLGANPLWNNMKSKKSSVSNDILGPSYNYSDNIPGPGTLGVGSGGSFSQLFTNVNAAVDYVKIMVTGDPQLGNAYYVNTGGACVAPDGSTQSRMNYINNVSTGSNLVPQSMNELSFVTSELNGLIPGMAGDVEGLDPLYIFNALAEEGTPQCQCYKCNVTTGSQYAFLTQSLSPDFDTNSCSQVDVSFCKSGKESFSNIETPMSVIPTIVAFGAFLFLTFSGK